MCISLFSGEDKLLKTFEIAVIRLVKRFFFEILCCIKPCADTKIPRHILALWKFCLVGEMNKLTVSYNTMRQVF